MSRRICEVLGDVPKLAAGFFVGATLAPLFLSLAPFASAIDSVVP